MTLTKTEGLRPVRPEDIKANTAFPDFVIQAFNDLITENLRNGVAYVLQEDIIKRIIAAQLPASVSSSQISQLRSQIFSKRWLDVESVYRDAGWKVYYDKPGYNESYNAYFKFTRETRDDRHKV